jgi:transcriptional regulator with XRE-family HTH domain
MPNTLGSEIVSRRKQLGYTQRQLAALVKKEDGESITPQFLNDIERDRRRPSAIVLQSLAEAIHAPSDELHRLAGQLPADIDPQRMSPERWKAAMKAFRRH